MAEKLTLAALNERINDALARALDMQRQVLEASKEVHAAKEAAEAASEDAKIAKEVVKAKSLEPLLNFNALSDRVVKLEDTFPVLSALEARIENLEAAVAAAPSEQPTLTRRIRRRVAAWLSPDKD